MGVKTEWMTYNADWWVGVSEVVNTKAGGIFNRGGLGKDSG